MISGFTTGVWNGLKRFCGNDDTVMSTAHAQGHSDVGKRDDDDTYPRRSRVIAGPSACSETRKPLDEVVDRYGHTTIDNWTLVKQFGNEGDNDGISSDVGIQIRRKFSENDTHKNVLCTAGQIKHPNAVTDDKFELSQQMRLFNVETSSVYGYRFNNFGVLARFKLRCNESEYSEWKKACQTVTFGLVFPVTAGQLALKPHNDSPMLDAYWKVNNKLEVATSLKSNWENPDWISHDHKLRMKYKHSDNVTCSLKTDPDGNITAELSLTEKCNSVKVCT